MDKDVYKIKIKKMLMLASKSKFRKAADIADSIDWRCVKNASNVSIMMVASMIYEQNNRYDNAREMLYLASDISKKNKNILYKLTELSIKSGDIENADNYFLQYKQIVEHDLNKYKLEYKLSKAKGKPVIDQIAILKSIKKNEYTEACGLELAKLYSDAGMIDECIKECDEMSIWYTDGYYVKSALMLKKQYADLTPGQEKIVNQEYKEENEELLNASAYAKILLIRELRAYAINNNSNTNRLKRDNNFALSKLIKHHNNFFNDHRIDYNTIDNTVIPGMSISDSLDMDIEDIMDKNGFSLPTSITSNLTDTFSDEQVADIDFEKHEKCDNIHDDNLKSIHNNKKRIGLGTFFLNKKNQDLINNKDIGGVDHIDNNNSAQKHIENNDGISKNIKVSSIKSLENNIEDSKQVDTKKVLQSNQFDSDKSLIKEKIDDQLQLIKLRDSNKTHCDSLNLQNEIKAGLAMLDKDDIIDSSESRTDQETEMTEINSKSVLEHEKDNKNTDIENNLRNDNIKINSLSTDVCNNEDKCIEEEYKLNSKGNKSADVLFTEYEKKVFSYFIKIHGMSDQILNVLNLIKNVKCDSEHTSKFGNLLIVGPDKCGKSKLAIGMIKTIYKEIKHKKCKMSIVNGASLNGKNIEEIFKKLYGGAILIEKAGGLNKDTIQIITNLMQQDTGNLFVVLEGSHNEISKVVSINNIFALSFIAKIIIPNFTNDELVAFALTYAKEHNYIIQEMAILALYNRIDRMQRDDCNVTVSNVIQIVEDAFDKSKKNSLKRTVTALFNKYNNKNNDNYTFLMEEDFE